MHEQTGPRRAFLKRVLSAGAALTATGPLDRLTAADVQATGVTALDHVAVPMSNPDEMIAFYRALGFTVRDGAQIVSIHFGDQKINFHRPALWQRESFTLKAPGARPPCGDFCWVWSGSEDALRGRLQQVGAEVVAEGQRDGGRNGGDAVGQSVYVRDPDGNLLEFIRYE